MEFQQHRLDNGLQVIAEINPRAYSTSVGFFVSAGARDEDSQIAGVSHFLEHMAFKGTPNRTAEEVNRELDEMGSHSNARTGEERTIYHSTVLPEFQDRAVELLADILRPSLRTDDFEMEKKVICEEIMMYDDQPPFGGHEKIMASYFGDHALGQSILGTVETVSSLTPEQMKSYFEQRYSPGNIALVAAGRVDFQGLVKVAEQCCGHWPAVDAPRKLVSAEPRLEFNCVEKETAAQQYLIQLCPGPFVSAGRQRCEFRFPPAVRPFWARWLGPPPLHLKVGGSTWEFPASCPMERELGKAIVWKEFLLFEWCGRVANCRTENQGASFQGAGPWRPGRTGS